MQSSIEPSSVISDPALHLLYSGKLYGQELAEQASLKIETEEVSLETAKGFTTRGVMITNLTQALAYRMIKSQRPATPRPATQRMLQNIQKQVRDVTGGAPLQEKLWKGIRDPEIPRRMRNFLWIMLHDAHRVGKYWKHIPECEDWMVCSHCMETEDIEHILLLCERPWCKLVWDIAKSLWPTDNDYGPWIEPSLGTTAGANLLHFTDAKGTPMPHAKCLYKILVTESAHLIWKLRCESVIDRENEDISEEETYNRMCHVLNQHLLRDKVLTYQPRWKQKAINKSLVLSTWNPLIKDRGKLPSDWTGDAEVLVGVGPLTLFRPHPQ